MVDEDAGLAPSSAAGRGDSTVVVVAYGVDALFLDWVPASVPVVIVHNDDLLATTAVDRPAVTHIFPGANVGFGAGVNAALERVTTPHVVLCNPDVRGDPRHWTALRERRSPRAGSGQPDRCRGTPAASVVNRYPTPAARVAHGVAIRTHRAAGQSTAPVAGAPARRVGKSSRRLSRCGLPGSWRAATRSSGTRTLAERRLGVDRHLAAKRRGQAWTRTTTYWEDVDLARGPAVAAPDSVG